MNKFLLLAGCLPIAFACGSPKYLTYEQFGARGDGVTDDFPAIMATHAAANKKGLPVKAAGGKTYYIGNTTGTAVIRTDVDFGTARFIIDDSRVGLEDREDYIFRVESSLATFNRKDSGAISLSISFKLFSNFVDNSSTCLLLSDVIIL